MTFIQCNVKLLLNIGASDLVIMWGKMYFSQSGLAITWYEKSKHKFYHIKTGRVANLYDFASSVEHKSLG